MKVELEPGCYVVAVSGGVDSVVLLHLLAEQSLVVSHQSIVSSHQISVDDKNAEQYFKDRKRISSSNLGLLTSDKQLETSDSNRLRLVVAHFDHGIRGDSNLDRKLVQQLAKKYNLPFVYEEGRLGPGASEATAREARYKFLRSIQKASQAQAIITAHHQDDQIETAIINMIRGTGRSGLSSLKDQYFLRRPMLQIPKSDIRKYAAEQGLKWREDSTNQDMALLRNYIRAQIIPKLGQSGRNSMLQYIGHMSVLNRAIDSDLLVYLHLQPSRQTLQRHAFIDLPHKVAIEVLASWLRSHKITNFDSKLLEQIVVKCKTLHPGKQIPIDSLHKILIGTETIALVKG